MIRLWYTWFWRKWTIFIKEIGRRVLTGRQYFMCMNVFLGVGKRVCLFVYGCVCVRTFFPIQFIRVKAGLSFRLYFRNEKVIRLVWNRSRLNLNWWQMQSSFCKTLHGVQRIRKSRRKWRVGGGRTQTEKPANHRFWRVNDIQGRRNDSHEKKSSKVFTNRRIMVKKNGTVQREVSSNKIKWEHMTK